MFYNGIISALYDLEIRLFLLPLGSEKRLREATANAVDIGHAKNILDLFCGTGTLTSLIAEKAKGNVFGVDLSENMIRRARKKTSSKNTKYIVADAKNIPFEDNYFDIAFESLGLHELRFKDRNKAIAEICRTLKKGGTAVFVEYVEPKKQTTAFLILEWIERIIDKEAIDDFFSRDFQRHLEYYKFKVINKIPALKGYANIFVAKKS
ncbi:class I SAM-dependent methyltransferase [Candidatus Woesearchaeota archaeon]|nr:class I SAM-dependent methyltransferase [Candidatus Woesearchaeota archaeon]